MNHELKSTRFMRLFAGVSIALSLGQAIAANQCITTAGTYGAVNVTQSAGCVEPGFSPYNYDGMDGFAIGTNFSNTSGVTCTIGFDHPILTSSISIDMSGHNPGDDTSFSTSSGVYSPVAADLNPTPLPTSPGTGPLEVSGNLIVTTGIGSGRFRFTNAPPATTTSITINHASQGAGTFFRVCLDDADATPSTPPTLVDDSFTVSRTVPTTLNVLLNDEAGVTLDASYALSLSDAAAGALTYLGGQIQFTPTSTFTAPLTFEYQACNTGGTCSLATVTLTPQAVLPVLADDSFTVSRSAPTALDVLLNDEVGVTLDTSYALSLSNAAAGTLAYSGSQIQFTPTNSFTAPVSFQYQACSASSICAVATGTLTPQAIAPTAPTPVPTLGGVALLLLSGTVAGSMGFMRQRKWN